MGLYNTVPADRFLKFRLPKHFLTGKVLLLISLKLLTILKWKKKNSKFGNLTQFLLIFFNV